MKKLISLIKACMTDKMSIFAIKSKKEKKRSVLPILATILVAFYSWFYANILIDQLAKYNLEFIVITIFAFLTSVLTFIQGVYKIGDLLFACKDDNLLLSLPIKKSTVLFVRIFKLYLFETAFNAVFLAPAMFAYAIRMNVDVSFYLISLLMLILLPVIPIILACVIGFIMISFVSKFKLKNLVQIIITMAVLTVIFVAAYNIEGFMKNIAEHANGINDFLTKLYYPVGVYITLLNDFNIKDLIIFIFVNIGVFTGLIFILSKFYFKINTKMLSNTKTSKNKNYKIKATTPTKAFIRKELAKFVSSPVFVTNAAFGLVLFVIGCIAFAYKFDLISGFIIEHTNLNTPREAYAFMPVVLSGFICAASLLSSITSSMISLEGRSFNILKSLPINTSKIIMFKVLTAVFVMIPFILMGDIIFIIRFKFDIVNILMILAISIVLPLVSELLGIIVNIKYPKMDAESDTEVVKQSASATVAVLIGMAMIGVTAFGLIKGVDLNIGFHKVVFIELIIYSLICLGLYLYLKNKSTKEFNEINV